MTRINRTMYVDRDQDPKGKMGYSLVDEADIPQSSGTRGAAYVALASAIEGKWGKDTLVTPTQVYLYLSDEKKMPLSYIDVDNILRAGKSAGFFKSARIK